ncbi:MAG: hypothetical protein WDW36_006955 [Sanguina aurantia]
MQTTSSADSSARPRAPWWFKLAGQLLQPWVRIRREPAEPAGLLQAGTPVCYVIERDSLTDSLILQRACLEAGLPSPMRALAGTRRRRAMFALTRRDGWMFGRNRKRTPNEPLSQLLRSLEATDRDIQIVPVSIYVGRAPTRDSGWFSVLFSENWVMVGRFRRGLALLLNGRDTVVHFSAPVSLRSVIDEAGDIAPERLTRKIARVLRTHFHRIRAAVIGPDLSHRRTVVDSVLNAEPVRSAIDASAAKEKISHAKAWRKAHGMVIEIAADYSHPVVRSVSFLLSNFWNKLYDGIAMHHFDKARAAAPGFEVVYVPSHRSHADYLLLSYQLHHADVVVPHIAAGVVEDLEPIRQMLFELQNDNGLPKWNDALAIDLRMSGIVEAWAAGATWAQVRVDHADSTMDDGDVARILIRTIDLLRQVVFNSTQLPYLKAAANEALKGMDRSPVAERVF